ncbi:peptidase S49 [Pandoraea thiooxydans]|uniref:Peptidase S49 n=1 Tax=Pandoraea thiooxydans TaxID=445709 RepID=A0A0G3EUG1_9BURK|nr:S49 family peptidase [Pandoraea thiooxydans]AKJ68952.1 peptidase S49 [Pandoraea thiooxydans]
MTESFPPDNPPRDESRPSDARQAVGRAGTDENWERTVLEKVLLATLKEQRAARRWKIFFRLVALALFGLIAWALMDTGTTPVTTAGRHTALVKLTGEISASGQASADAINKALDSAFADSGTAGVILRINSPGGSPVQAGRIYDEIMRLRAKYPAKPIYVVVDEMCASGGYYVAAAADKIFVNQASIVGSIGVLMDGFGFTGLMDKLGIERRLLTAGKNKGFLDPFSPETDEQKAYALQMLSDVHRQFIDAVKKGRGARLKNDPQLFSGLFWTGEKSIQLGLADGYGTVDSVARDVIKASDIVDYTVKESFPDRVARRFGAAVGNAAIETLLMSGRMSMR